MTLHLADRPPTDESDAVYGAVATFSSIATKAARARELMRYNVDTYELRLAVARMEARDLVDELLPLAELPTYHASLRVLNEVRRELGTKDPDVHALRRNLDLYLDGQPSRT